MTKGTEKGKRTRDSSADREGEPQEKTEQGQKTVYCGNLAWSVAWQDLKDHLKTVGPVEYCEILQYKDGRRTGSGIARFEKVEDAEKAIETLKDTELNGRPLLIRADRENGQGPGSRKGKGKSAPLPEDKADKQVYIGNLSWKTSWRGLKTFCEDNFGSVEYCDILVDKEGRSAGAGLVRFHEQADADKAKEELDEDNQYELDDRKVYIREDRQRRNIVGMSDKGKGKKGKGKKGNGKKGGEEWSLFVGNLEKGTDWKALKEAFKDYWPTHVTITETKTDKCFAVVKFQKASHAEEAIDAMHQAWIGDNQVSVRWDERPQ